MNKSIVKLGDHSFVTKLAGFEHTKYIQHNATHEINDIPLVIGKNIKNGRVIYDFDWYIPKKISEALPRSVLNKRCIVIPYVGSRLGELAIFENDITCHLGSNVAKLELLDDVIDLEYLYYYLKSSYGQSQLFKDKQGSAQPNITMDSIRKTLVVTFERTYQKKISKVLSAIDMKIELNNRINSVLEKMAKRLYDYWFVQFDFPDSLGKPYKTNGGKMIWSEDLKRNIPDRWEVGSLLDIAEYTNGLACQKFRPTGSGCLRVIKIKEMHEGFSSETEFVRDDIPPKVIIEDGDILFSWSASLEVQIWTGGKGALNQHIFKVTSEKYPKSFYYFQLVNYIEHFKMMAENRKTTMGHITQDHLEQSRIVLPPQKLTEILENIIKPFLEMSINNKVENHKLSELRNWLLPMLMNGQVNVT
ncbi:MAG TPA: restriction endonuclease subunit S [Ferruginibacter sp.]|jgi:type I restriction enzyme S subunit|nr:restriction endonuclease subunit S [Ferruginibacter sp.]